MTAPVAPLEPPGHARLETTAGARRRAAGRVALAFVALLVLAERGG